MLTVEQARQQVLASMETTPAVDVELEAALGLVAAIDVLSPEPIPRFDNSSMDGYAVRAADVSAASQSEPVALRIIDESKAGAPATSSLQPGTAIRIMTGAELPPDADGIVIVEDTQENDEGVWVKAPSGPFIRRRGEDLAAGEVAVPAGTELDPGALAMLASCGVVDVTVHRRPRVALLVTGDELADAGDALGPGQIRDSNSIALRTLVSSTGAEVSSYALVPDELDATLTTFEEASHNADLIVSSGGVAVGRYDLVRDVVEKLGRVDLWRVAMQPGKPVVLGAVNEVPFLGLPGNPVSVHVSFEQFVRPAIRKMLGCAGLLRPRLPALLTQDITKKSGRLHFVRVRLHWHEGVLRATPTGPQGSHIQSSLVACDGLAIFPLEAEHLAADSEVVVEVWTLP